MKKLFLDSWRVFLFTLVLCVSAATSADPADLSGNWRLDKDASGTLDAEVNQLKQEARDWQSEHGTINDPNKPDPFDSGRRDSRNWDSRRGGAVPTASVTTREMLESESLKLYVSQRVIVSYDGGLRRRVQPNPAGRVYSATGKGVSKDAIGDTLAYFDGDAFVIETITTSAERLSERFELRAPDELKLTTTLKNPEWRREIAFVRYYTRD